MDNLAAPDEFLQGLSQYSVFQAKSSGELKFVIVKVVGQDGYVIVTGSAHNQHWAIAKWFWERNDFRLEEVQGGGRLDWNATQVRVYGTSQHYGAAKTNVVTELIKAAMEREGLSDHELSIEDTRE